MAAEANRMQTFWIFETNIIIQSSQPQNDCYQKFLFRYLKRIISKAYIPKLSKNIYTFIHLNKQKFIYLQKIKYSI